jgi:hypothetical protein
MDDIFLDENKRRALIPVTSNDKNQEFVIEIISMQERSTQHFCRQGPKKSDFAKSAIGLITKSILGTFTNIRIFSTDIGSYIQKRIIDKDNL